MNYKAAHIGRQCQAITGSTHLVGVLKLNKYSAEYSLHDLDCSLVVRLPVGHNIHYTTGTNICTATY